MKGKSSRQRPLLAIGCSEYSISSCFNRNYLNKELKWSDISHVWRPAAPGSYAIRLRVPDDGIVTRRLDRGYYDRTVTIEET